MSRIGKHPIPVPAGVEVSIEGNHIHIKGPKGELDYDFNTMMNVVFEDGQIVVTRPDDSRQAKSFHGLTRTLIANMVEGVSNGFQKKLELVGVGYRAALKGSNLEMQLGYSHPVVVEPPAGITFEVPDQTHIVVNGADKQQVGETAAVIRKWRKPEPYKGKGIRYEGEVVRRKLGKAAKGDK
ncbi:50S ribosomal protein L6 [uncultured Slackia sp.]|uniref:50S ribosomal protein L6 n=1 Tax=uncultured Slackia sp. TaxID=665903 RepID=UPI002600BD89|nr:50S ribosomal protein L6 [uncultured Slackia sp.]